MSTDAAYEEGIGRIPPQGCLQTDGMAVMEGAVRRLGLPPYGGCEGGGGVAGVGDLRLPSPEHSRAIYCNYNHYIPVSSSKMDARGKGGNAVVVTGGFGFGGDADSGPGGGADGGVRGEGREGDYDGRLVKLGGYCRKHNFRERA